MEEEKEAVKEAAVEEKSPAAKEKKIKQKENFLLSGVPLYLLILFLVVGLLGGYVLRMTTEGPAVDGNQNPDNGNTQPNLPTIKATLLYSDECTVCDKTNSLLSVLSLNKIPVELDQVEVSSDQGKKLVAQFNVRSVPTVLVVASSVTSDFMTVNDRGEEVKFKDALAQTLYKGNYVVEEYYIDGLPHPKMFLANPSQSCSASGGKARIDIFSDFFSEESYSLFKAAGALKAKLGQEIDINIRHLVKSGTPAAVIANAAECARDQGEFDEFTLLAFAERFDKVGSLEGFRNSSDLNAGSYVITDENLFYAKLNELAESAGMPDLGKFSACAQNGDHIEEIFTDGTDRKMIDAFGLDYVPSFVVDCKYVFIGSAQDLSKPVCDAHPSLKACS
ncbi:MAG: hypothetical protein V1494_03985 [Candidatus Diapherotrites archaeon]